MVTWAPQQAGLDTLTRLLTEYRQPGANQAQASAHAARVSRSQHA